MKNENHGAHNTRKETVMNEQRCKTKTKRREVTMRQRMVAITVVLMLVASFAAPVFAFAGNTDETDFIFDTINYKTNTDWRGKWDYTPSCLYVDAIASMWSDATFYAYVLGGKVIGNAFQYTDCTYGDPTYFYYDGQWEYLPNLVKETYGADALASIEMVPDFFVWFLFVTAWWSPDSL